MDIKKSIIDVENFITILDSVPAIIFWQDLNGTYLGSNKYIVNMTDASCQDIIGKTDKDLAWNAETQLQLQELDSIIINTQSKYQIEIKGLNGCIYLLTKTPMYDNYDKKLIGLIGVATDINDYDDKKIVNALKVLSGGIAHDMRTPISAININIENLKNELKKSQENATINKIIDNIRFSLNNCNKFINMLDTKLHIILKEQDKYYKFTQNSIKKCINDALKEYNFFGSEKEYIQWNDKENEDFIYLGDDLLTKHIIFNLIKNSIKAFKESDKDLSLNKIFINLSTDKKFNYLIFKDTADGICCDIFENLFNKFNGDKDSAGLGLTFCKMVMGLYGGEITCVSKFGNYTEFTLKFPILNKIG